MCRGPQLLLRQRICVIPPAVTLWPFSKCASYIYPQRRRCVMSVYLTQFFIMCNRTPEIYGGTVSISPTSSFDLMSSYSWICLGLSAFTHHALSNFDMLSASMPCHQLDTQVVLPETGCEKSCRFYAVLKENVLAPCLLKHNIALYYS